MPNRPSTNVHPEEAQPEEICADCGREMFIVESPAPIFQHAPPLNDPYGYYACPVCNLTDFDDVD